MNAEKLLYHLMQLGVSLALTSNARDLEIDAPRGVMTPELAELMREHKSDLIELVYLREEAEAIAWEGCLGESRRPVAVVKYEGEASLIDRYKNHPTVRMLADFCNRHGGGTLEIRPDERRRVA